MALVAVYIYSNNSLSSSVAEDINKSKHNFLVEARAVQIPKYCTLELLNEARYKFNLII